MEKQPRRSIRYANRARHAARPRLHGQSRRSIRATRIAREAVPRAVTYPQLTRPRGTRRRAPTWVLLLALLPVLLLTAAGVYALNLLTHTERAVQKVSRPSVAQVLHATDATSAAPDVRPTNTPDARNIVAPLPTFTPAPTALPPPRFDRQDPFTVLLLGVDARADDADPARSDTIILLYVDPAEKIAHLLSIPRDLYVTQPGGGKTKITDVYANGEVLKYKGIGGVALVWDTIEENFQIKIDYYAQVDFGGFVRIVDTLGGVTIDNPYPIKDDEYPTEDYQFTRVYFPAGIMHLYGAEALQYARTRHDDNDFQRNNRQQQVILGIRRQAVQLNLLTHATSLIDALGDTVRTDFPTDQWIGFAKLATDLPDGAITQYTLNDIVFNEPINGVYYAGVDWDKALARVREFSPKENFPAIQGLVSQGVDKGAKITVENGTRNGGLANRWATVLRGQGFTSAIYIDAPAAMKGAVSRTRVLYFGQNRETALGLARILTLDASSVQDGNGRRPAEAPPDADIVIVLGDDARDPGGASPQ
jgi:LCP family protein required for cell wall assembly